MCYKNPWVLHPNANFIKIHNPSPAYTYFPIGNITLDGFVFNERTRLDFNTIKISVDSYDDKIECALLKLSKDQQLTPKNVLQHIHIGEVHINDVKTYDHLFDYNVPYESLWDIEYIDDLYHQFTDNHLTSDEMERINYNIVINRKLIESAKLSIGEKELEKIYNHFFNGIAYN